jgi:hypothetical protein
MARVLSGKICVVSFPEHSSEHNDKRLPLAGLTIEETIEFEELDALPPVDENGNIAWTFEGEPTTKRERRWLELYLKHMESSQPTGAWKI